MFDDIWDGTAFTLVQMVQSINRAPYVPSVLDQVIPWEEIDCPTPDFALDITDTGEIDIVPSAPRGSPGDIMDDDKAETAKFPIPGYARQASVYNHEVLGARLPGGAGLRTVQSERDRKTAKLRAQFGLTLEHQRSKALTGVITDKNGKVLVNTLDLLGVSQPKVEITLGDSAEDLSDQLVDLKEMTEDALGAYTPERYVWLHGRNVNQKVRKDEGYKKLVTPPTDYRLTTGDNRGLNGAKLIQDNVWVTSYARAGFFDPDKSYLIPIFQGCAKTVFGPSSSEQYLGQVLPFYLDKKKMDFDEGLLIRGTMYAMNYFTRPECITEVTIKP
ncbi:major capsid protein [Aurantimonas coralicida]|uniref:major capsid protein n=1 Tax=Aurantimonas coralicida TaxID=182270 RepID=UPI001D191C5A|nr:major capsid protein [Aurantimonas coralicida]MCC4298434.1 major capsid protein [Aurantimonas coralicida]